MSNAPPINPGGSEQPPDPGHLLPDDAWEQIKRRAHEHPDNPHNPGNDLLPDPDAQ